MSRQQITPEIEQWILDQAAAGFDHQQLLESMRASGWEYETAVSAIAQLLCPAMPEPMAGATPQPAPRVPGPDRSRAATQLDAGDRLVRVLLRVANPSLVVFESFLADEECDELIRLARPRLDTSKTVDRESGGSVIHPARSSSGMFFARGENPLCARIEKRISRLLRWPVESGEGLQILQYGPGAEYKPHHDYFDAQQPDLASILASGGQRVGTLIMYLHDTRRGGATIFPDAGLEIAPIKGNAVFFSYAQPDPSTRSLHGGAPVLEGEKWIATKWLRAETF